MAVETEPEQHQIENGRRTGHPAELVLAELGGRRRRELRTPAMDLRLRNRERPEERFAGHAIVARGIVGRHAPLVSPEEIDRRPVQFFFPARDFLVRRAWRRPAGKGDEESSAGLDRLPGAAEELVGSAAGEGRRILEDEPFAQSFRQRRPSRSMNVFAATSGPIVPAG